MTINYNKIKIIQKDDLILYQSMENDQGLSEDYSLDCALSIIFGSINLLKYFIEEKGLGISNESNGVFLASAVQNKNPECVHYLLSKQNNYFHDDVISSIDENYDDLTILKYLVEHGYDPKIMLISNNKEIVTLGKKHKNNNELANLYKNKRRLL